MQTSIFAHRGASHLAPENTMPAFKLAYQLSAEGIETDVHLTKDQVPVLIHDEHLKRTTNGTGYVKDYTLSELEKLDAGSWFSDKFSHASIISLEDFLKWSKHKDFLLNIELKNNKIDYLHLETIVYEMIRKYQLQNRTILSTFNENSIKRMKNFTDIEIALLTSKKSKNLVNDAKQMGANALHIKYRLLNPKLIEQAQQENMAVRVYTINKQAHMRRCFANQCDGIFTDIPDLAIEQRKLYSKENLYD